MAGVCSARQTLAMWLRECSKGGGYGDWTAGFCLQVCPILLAASLSLVPALWTLTDYSCMLHVYPCIALLPSLLLSSMERCVNRQTMYVDMSLAIWCRIQNSNACDITPLYNIAWPILYHCMSCKLCQNATPVTAPPGWAKHIPKLQLLKLQKIDTITVWIGYNNRSVLNFNQSNEIINFESMKNTMVLLLSLLIEINDLL